ncbi:hypothetical protein [Nocardioides astragali]|uniref:PqqD family protein n=1 Tax=Nocardioides astragali TaxID=1776736 RepID=A0ABW2MYD0_9ACTN|nr:hypothetical protein [Nocardioides astragali]
MAHSTATHVVLRPLVMVEDTDAWIVGRPDAGDFVALPGAAVTFLEALRRESDVAVAEQCVLDAHAADIDSEDFIATLLELGYIASIDGETQPDDARPASFPALRPPHVAWMFSPFSSVCVLLTGLAGALVASSSAHLVPSYHAFFVTPLDGVNIALNTGMFLLVVAGHEMNHLAAARADGVHATIGLGTRLNMLAATTTVPGMWAAPRRARFRVYLAGMRFDLTVFAALALAQETVDANGLAYGLMESLRLAILVSLVTQFALYMRTDMYFVAQELLRCRNLYGDAWAYLRHVFTPADVRAGRPDPTVLLPEREQAKVRVYAWFMLLGSGATLASFALFGGPILVGLVGNAWESISAGSPVGVIDGLLVLLVEICLQGLFLVVFWRRHGATVRRFLSRTVFRVRGARRPSAISSRG